MAYSRNEYLKQLNRMRSNYQNNGNALINPMDDSTAVGEELSSFAYMNTPTPSMPQENIVAEQYKDSRNGWQRTMDTFDDFNANVTTGVVNFLDSVGDFLIGLSGQVGSWFGADTQWAEKAIQYDWVSPTSEVIAGVFNPFDILSGDIFTPQYYDELKMMFTQEGAQQLAAQRRAGSWVSDANSNFQNLYQNISVGIGELLPSVALAVATGGQSVGVQMAVQGGVTAIKTTGQSTELALQEGADLGGALGYGAIKGTVAGTITAATVGIGGSVLSNGGGIVTKGAQKIGEKVGQVFLNKGTAEVIAGKTSEILMRAGIDATSAAAQTLVDPVLKQFTYDSEAIQKAYGSSEAIHNTLANLGDVMLQAGLTSAILSTGKELVSLGKAGSFDKYKENYFVNKETSANYIKSEKYRKEYDKLCKQYYKISGLESGNLLSEDEFIDLSMNFSKKIQKLGDKYKVSELLNDVSNDKSYVGTGAEKYAAPIREVKSHIGQTIHNRAVNNVLPKVIALKYIIESGFNKTNQNGSYQNASGTLKIDYNETTGISTITTPNNPNSPIPLTENKATGDVSVLIQTPNQATAMLSTLQNKDAYSSLPSTFTYNNETYPLTTRSLNLVVTKEETKDNKLYGLKDGETALKYLKNNYTEEELSHLNNTKTQVITNGEELANYVYNAINNPDTIKQKALLGRISDSTALKLKEDTGTDFSNFSLAYDKQNIKHIINRHINNQKETMPLSYNDILKFPYIMENYDEVIKTDKNVLIVKKAIGDDYQLIAEYSMKSHNLVLKTLYKTKKERNKSLPVVHDSKESLLYTPKTQSGVSSSSTTNIAKAGKKKQEENKNSPQLVKDSANLRKEKVYNLKTTTGIVKSVLTDIRLDLPDNVEVKISGSKDSLIQATFEDINLSKSIDAVVDNLAEKILNTKVFINKGTPDEIQGLVSGYVSPKMQRNLKTYIRSLIESKGDKTKIVKIAEEYARIIGNLKTKIGELRERSEYLIDSIKTIKSIGKKVDNSKSLRASGDMVVEEIQLISNLIKGIKLSKSAKGISPLSVTHFVYNLKSYTPEVCENSILGYNGDLKLIADYFEALFVNGSFPNRELTLDETRYFVKALKYINAMAKELQSEKSRQMLETVQQVHKETLFIKERVKQPKYNAIKGLKDGTISAPSYFSMLLGEDHPFVQLITKEYMTAYNNKLEVSYSFEQLVTETIPQDMNIKYKAIKKKLSKHVKFKGKKYPVDQLVDAYATCKANEEAVKVGFDFSNKQTGTTDRVVFTKEELSEIEKLIPEECKIYADEVCSKGYNGQFKDYLSKKYREFTGVKLELVSDYYPQQRGKLNNSGLESLNSNNKGFLTTSNTSIIKSRTGSKSPFKIVGFTKRLDEYTKKVSYYGEFTNYVDKYRIYMNKKVDGESLNNLFEEVIPNWNGKKGWSELLTRIILEKPVADKEGGLLTSLYSNAVTAVLGINPSVVLKQFASEFTLACYSGWGVWTKTLLKGVLNISKWNKISAIIEEQQPYFTERWSTGEVIKAQSGSRKSNFITKFAGFGMEKADKAVIVGHAWAIAQYLAKERGFGDYWTETNNAAAAAILTDLVLNTQSNSQPMYMSPLRHGWYGSITRTVFGIFGSDSQNKTQLINRCVVEREYAKRRENAYKKAMQDPDNTDEEKEFYKKGYNSARKQHKKLAKLIPTLLVSLLLSGIAAEIASMISDRLKGKEDWDDFNTDEFIHGTSMETLFRWIPYIGTIVNAIENNSDVTVISLDKINELIDASVTIQEAIETGDEAKIRKAVYQFLIAITETFGGFPTKNLLDLIYGTIYQFDKDAALYVKSWTNGYSSQSMKKIYNSNLEDDNLERAAANLQVWSSLYSVQLTDQLSKEITALEAEGYSAAPKATLVYYSNDKGEKVSLTGAQKKNFYKYYKLSNNSATELTEISDYKSLDNENKAKLIKKIYDTYYDYAKMKVIGATSSNKLVNLLAITNGRLGLSKFVIGVNALSNIEAIGQKTRKELVLEQINKMKGYSKAEKLLLVYLSGFSLTDSNKTSLQLYLINQGANLKDAQNLFG